MPKQFNKPPEETPEGAPEWMVTFSDCMTLLLTFFVLLISFASFDEETLPVLGESFANALPAIGLSGNNKKDSMLEREPPPSQTPDADGSETPTDAKTHETNFMQEKKPLDFKNLKVFTVESSEFFLGDTTVISQPAREVLDALAEFINSQTGRVVISENGPEKDHTLGFNRCMTVMAYLNTRHKIHKKRFNISTSTTLRTAPKQRQLEITLLDRSIYE